MSHTCTSAFTIGEWKEVENTDWEGGKLTRTLATKAFTGELKGSATIEAVMLRLNGESNAMAYVGVERIDCELDGRKGSFVLVHNAEALGEDRIATWKIMPGSGTGELTGISGTGQITPEHNFILNYMLG